MREKLSNIIEKKTKRKLNKKESLEKYLNLAKKKGKNYGKLRANSCPSELYEVRIIGNFRIGQSITVIS